MSKISEEALGWSPWKWDKYLQRRYRRSLYFFALSIVDIYHRIYPRNIDVKQILISKTAIPYAVFWRDRIQNLRMIKRASKTLLKNWDEFNGYLLRVPPILRNSMIPIQDAIEAFRHSAGDYYNSLDNLIEVLNKRYLDDKLHRGRVVRNFSILFLAWSFIIADEKRTNIKELLLLLHWFANRVFFLKDERITEDNLNKTLYRLRHKKEKSVLTSANKYAIRLLRYGQFMEIRKFRMIVRPRAPIIIFSNGEKLTGAACIRNLKDKSDVLSELSTSPILIDFRFSGREEAATRKFDTIVHLLDRFFKKNPTFEELGLYEH